MDWLLAAVAIFMLIPNPLVVFIRRRWPTRRDTDLLLDDIAAYLTACDLNPTPVTDELWRQYNDARHAALEGDYPSADRQAREIADQIKQGVSAVG